MPDLSGIQFLRTLPRKPSVIFVTAYNEFAVEGFELDAIDYLLKPVPFDRFVGAVSKAYEYISYRKNNRQVNANDDFIFIKTSHKIQKIFYEDIIYLEGLKDYTRIHLSGSRKPIVTLQSLKYFRKPFTFYQFYPHSSLLYCLAAKAGHRVAQNSFPR